MKIQDLLLDEGVGRGHVYLQTGGKRDWAERAVRRDPARLGDACPGHNGHPFYF
jgi:hypothetical protein